MLHKATICFICYCCNPCESALYHCIAPPWVKAVINSTLYHSQSASEDHETASQVSFSSANLECIVEQGDSFKGIEWRRGGKILTAVHDRGTMQKYVIQRPFAADGESNTTLSHMLTVRNVDDDDAGEYECLLYSRYNGTEPESSKKVSLEILRVSGTCYYRKSMFFCKTSAIIYGHNTYIDCSLTCRCIVVYTCIYVILTLNSRISPCLNPVTYCHSRVCTRYLL